jgi:hypothetical protein
MENEFKYKGISNGKVDDCGFCEHCGDLTKGTKWFYVDGTNWCLYCLNQTDDIYYDPVSDYIFDDVFSIKWNEYVVLLGSLDS